MEEEKKLAEENNEDVQIRLYELSFLVLPSVDEKDIEKEFDTIKKNVTDVGGDVNSEEAPQKIDLQYEMVKKIEGKNKKFGNAYFGWVRFEAEPQNLEGLKEEIEKNKNILRYLLVLVDKDSFIPTGRDEKEKFSEKKVSSVKPKKEEATTNEVVPEEKEKKSFSKEDLQKIDKTIDDIVEGSEGMLDKARSTE